MSIFFLTFFGFFCIIIITIIVTDLKQIYLRRQNHEGIEGNKDREKPYDRVRR